MFGESLYDVDTLKAVGSQDVTDRDIANAAVGLAESPAEFASPELLYGSEAWAERLVEDPDGVKSRAAFDFDWDFEMTPAQRSRAVWTTGMKEGGFALLRGMDEATHKASVSVDASHLDAIRRRRGIGGM